MPRRGVHLRVLPAAVLLMLAPGPGPRAADPAATHPGRMVQAGAARLFVETEGSGPPLFLLPAAPGIDHAWFHPYLSGLAGSATVVYFDPAGCGRSEPARGEGDPLQGAITDLEALRSALGFERIDLLGHGFGAAVATQYADRHPDRVGRLVLVGPTGRAGAYLSAPGVARALTPGMQHALEAAASDRYLSADGRFRQKIRILAPLLFHRLTDRSFHRAFADALTATAAVYEAAAAAHPGGEAGADLLPALQRLKHPILIVAGRHDLTAPMDAVEAVRRAAPGSRLAVLEESGAVPFADQPVEFQKAVRAFLLDREPDREAATAPDRR